jgi:hypothetical protein
MLDISDRPMLIYIGYPGNGAAVSEVPEKALDKPVPDVVG